MRFLILECTKDVISFGRNEDGLPDNNFIKGKLYDMCFDANKKECFTVDEVEQMHFIGYEGDYFFDTHFKIIEELKTSDELRLQRLKRIFKEKHNYEEE